MTIRMQLLAGLTSTLVFYGAALATGDGSAQAETFGKVTVRFEQNVKDRDVEVVFEISGGDEGLSKLTVVSPDGRTVINFTAPDASTLGMRSFKLESPEPKDIEGLKSAYSEGTYIFTGTTVAGKKLHGESTLSHALPTPVSFLRPGVDATSVGTENLEISWTPVDDAVAYFVEIEQDDLSMKIKAQLPKTADAFAVPVNFLHSGMEYQLSIGAVSSRGNISVSETTFTTSE